MPQEAEKRVVRSVGANAGLQANRGCAFRFGKAAANKRLDSGRCLILMRQYHGKGYGRPFGRFQLLAGS